MEPSTGQGAASEMEPAASESLDPLAGEGAVSESARATFKGFITLPKAESRPVVTSSPYLKELQSANAKNLKLNYEKNQADKGMELQ